MLRRFDVQIRDEARGRIGVLFPRGCDIFGIGELLSQDPELFVFLIETPYTKKSLCGSSVNYSTSP